MSDESKEYLDGLDKDVTIYVMSLKENVELPVVKILDEFDSYSNHIRVEYVDLTKNPQFASKYVDETAVGGDMIVVCGDNAALVPSSDLFQTEIDYQTFSETVTGLDAEGQIISAVARVTSDRKTVMKTVTGHGEFKDTEMGLLYSSLKKAGMDIEELNLLSVESIDDCDMIMIAAPLEDYTEEDCEKIKAYLEDGGSAVILSAYSENGKELTNFDSLLADYGVTITGGIIEDTDPAHYYGNNPMYLLPQVYETPASKTVSTQRRYVFMPYAQVISLDEDNKEDASIAEILMTTSSSFVKKDLRDGDSLEKSEGDTDGPFTVGAYITKDDTKIALFSSAMAFTDDACRAVGDANITMITDAAKDMAPVVTGPVIPVKSYGTEYLTISAAFVILYSLIFIILVPLLILSFSIILWARRRKR